MAQKPAWLFSQAGALPYRQVDGKVRVVLITSLSSKRWIFPKGVIDPGQTPESTAIKEAREEAGLIGAIAGESLGYYEQEKWGGVAKIEVFPFLVSEILDDWDERTSRERAIVSVDEAKQMMHTPLVEILDSFEHSFDSGGTGPIE